MNFLQPFMFWGALTIAIPIFIHFWHQKRGKELDWAVMQWLIDKSQQQSRGLRLDDLPLLIVRCLLVLLLTFLVSQPVLKWLKKTDQSNRVHLVEPSAYLADSYRFELETAIKKGEKVFLINADGEEIKTLSSISGQRNSGALHLQELINKVSRPGVTLDLYLLNDQKWMDMPKIYMPNTYTLHTAIDSSQHYPHNYFDLGVGKKLVVNKGKLVILEAGQSQNIPRLASNPIHTGALKVLVDYQNQAEQQTVEAALGALSTVYMLPIDIAKKADKDNRYDLVLTDQKVDHIKPEVLYVLSGMCGKALETGNANVVPMRDSLRIQTSEMVHSGQLPEYLGDLLIRHFNLDEKRGALSQKQFNTPFVRANPPAENVDGNMRKWLLMVFIGLVMLERWMAIKKTIQKSYV